MRKLYFGGAFNPIHHGHLVCGRAAAEAAGFDRLVLVPSGIPPFKRGDADLASSEDRAAMCRLAAGSAPDDFEVDTLEVDRATPSYTYDTAAALRARDGKRPTWLIGADALIDLHRWHRAEELAAEVDFLVMARPGHPIKWDALSASARSLQDRVVITPLLEISATDIRQRVARRQSIAFLTPAPVCDFIERNHLYRS